MYPEAGGSSSFARRAFNEFWSFFAAWGQMLNYTITIAISAFFVPHYIGGILWSPLRHSPGDIFGGIVVVAVLSADQRPRGRRSPPGVNILLAVVDFCTQLLLVVVGAVLVFSPDTLVEQRPPSASRRRGRTSSSRSRSAMIAYTGIETISNMAEEAKDEEKTIPAAINRVVIAVFVIYAALPAVALSALPVTQNADGTYQTLLGLTEEQGGYAGDPILGVVKHARPRRAPAAGRDLRRPARRDDPVHRDERGHHRRVAARVLDGPAPPDARPAAPAAPEVRHPVDRDPRLRRRRLHRDAPGPGRLPRLHVRVRRDALVLDRARVASSACGSPSPTGGARTAGPASCASAATTCRCSPLIGMLGTGAGVHRRDGPPRQRGDRGHRRGWRSAIVFYTVYRHGQGLDLTTTTKVALPAPVTEHEAEYQSVLVALDVKHYSEGAVATAAKVAARRRRGIHVLVTIPVPGVVADHGRDARAGARRAGDPRAGAHPGRAARQRPLREGPPRPGRAHDRQRGARDARPGGRAAAARRGRAARCSARRSRPCSPSARAG